MCVRVRACARAFVRASGGRAADRGAGADDAALGALVDAVVGEDSAGRIHHRHPEAAVARHHVALELNPAAPPTDDARLRRARMRVGMSESRVRGACVLEESSERQLSHTRGRIGETKAYGGTAREHPEGIRWQGARRPDCSG
jgi:hypothetical protein